MSNGCSARQDAGSATVSREISVIRRMVARQTIANGKKETCLTCFSFAGRALEQGSSSGIKGLRLRGLADQPAAVSGCCIRLLYPAEVHSGTKGGCRLFRAEPDKNCRGATVPPLSGFCRSIWAKGWQVCPIFSYSQAESDDKMRG